MELIIGIAIGLSVAPIVISTLALIKVINIDTRLGGIEKSTHSIHPVPVEAANNPIKKFEEQMKKMTGNNEDFNSDLERQGFNPSFLPSQNPDDLV